MIPQDKLWKGLTEDFFLQFLSFFHHDFVQEVDTSIPFDFLDKDLEELFPESKGISRIADKLVKVHTKTGNPKVILFHIEFQGYYDAEFRERMFTYYYRLHDRYKLPISVLVIFTDKKAEIAKTGYQSRCLDTELIFNFPIFCVNDYEPSYFDKFENPISEALKIAWYFQDSFKRNFKTDELLKELKLQLSKELLRKGYKKELIRHLIMFIKHYVNFQKEEYYTIFDKTIEQYIKPQQPMGLLEIVKEAELNHREQKGIEKGKLEIIHNMLKANFGIDTIANLANVDTTMITNIKKEIEKKRIS